MRWLLTLAVVVLLTLLTQIGGAVWLVTRALLRRRRAGVAMFLALFLGLYAAGPRSAMPLRRSSAACLCPVSTTARRG
ncbi:hypothetical protein [Ensifer sp. ENS09]|uniref:hypothetical protein n=1 Tax=Ensifer sp. ENS09 TaxID=2769263 RepID=UPI001FED6478|nr:hypothetical protein [Ensifer sp. ENS09]